MVAINIHQHGYYSFNLLNKSMFKNFFNKLNSNKQQELKPSAVPASPITYDEVYKSISGVSEGDELEHNVLNKVQLGSANKSIYIPEEVQIIEMENFLHIEGNSKDLQRISDEIQSMEFQDPGVLYMFGEWRFLVTDGSIMSSKEEKFIALPPEEWLMMGCKFNDAISGYDFNPYTFFSSLFASYTLPYGIEILITDNIIDQAEEE